MTDDEKIVRLVLSCVQVESCSVIFEPFGTEYVLEDADEFHIEVKGPGSGELIVWYGPGAISITPWPGADYSSVVTSSGTILDV